MSKIYVFGGSYSQESDNSISWVYKLASKYDVTNLSGSNKTNSEIYLDLLLVKDKLTTNDIILVVWNDSLFPYIKDLEKIKNKHEVVSLYLEYFYHEKLSEEHYKFYLNSFKQIASEKNIKLIALWSVPSNYIDSNKWPWQKKDHHTDYKNHTYLVDFPNDIRPSLMYFSKTELEHLKISKTEKEKYIVDDPRPNHIQSEQTHDVIFNAIRDVIDGKQSGLIELPL